MNRCTRMAFLSLAFGILILCAASPAEAGKAYIRNQIHTYFASDFSDFRPPAPGMVKLAGINHTYSNATFDGVWESLLLIVSQKAVIVSSSKETGVIAAFQKPKNILFDQESDDALILPVSEYPPYILVERASQEGVVVHLAWDPALYEPTNNPEKVLFKMPERNLVGLSVLLFYQLETQLYTERILGKVQARTEGGEP